jgi:hypothetical protein
MSVKSGIGSDGETVLLIISPIISKISCFYGRNRIQYIILMSKKPINNFSFIYVVNIFYYRNA